LDPQGLWPWKKKKGPPPPPAAPPGPPLNPGILKDGGIITFENPKGVDHSVFYVKDPSSPSGYRVGTHQPGGFCDKDLVDYLHERPPTDTIYIDPVIDVRPDKGRRAIQDMKNQDPDYNAANKCTDVCIILLYESGGPVVDGGGTQIPMRLRDKIREHEDQRPGRVYPPESRPPANPKPAPPPAQNPQQPRRRNPWHGPTRRRIEAARSASDDRRLSASTSTVWRSVLMFVSLLVGLAASPAPASEQLPDDHFETWLSWLESDSFRHMAGREGRDLAISAAARNPRSFAAALEMLASNDIREFRTACAVIDSVEPTLETLEYLLAVGGDASRPEKIRSWALLSADSIAATGLLNTPPAVPLSVDTGHPEHHLRLMRAWMADHPPVFGPDRLGRAGEVLEAATTQLSKRAASGEPNPDAYEPEWKLIQFHRPFLIQPGASSTDAAHVLIRHLQSLQSVPRVSDAVDLMVARLMLGALYDLFGHTGMIERLDDMAIRQWSRQTAQHIVAATLDTWDNQYSVTEDPVQWRVLSLARAGWRIARDDEPEHVLLSLMEAIRAGDAISAVAAGGVLKDLNMIEAGMGIPSMKLAFDPEHATVGERLVLDAWRGRVLTEAARYAIAHGAGPQWNAVTARWEPARPRGDSPGPGAD
jgi:hypothetical protein